MKVAIDVADLKLGMQVVELDCPWRNTPFLFQGFEIRSEEEIRTLRQYCKRVYILLHDAAPAETERNWQPMENRRLLVEGEIFKLNNHPSAQPVREDLTSFEDEARRIRDAFIDTRLLIQEVMHDAKLGRSLNIPDVKKAVRSLAESVLRNPDALMCFTQLKRKDDYTAMHNLRVCILALAFGRHLGMGPDQLEALGLGALLHDIGMVRVPDEIVNKPEALTHAEQEIMRRHVDWGVEILLGTNQIPAVSIDMVRKHHERYDGSGYMAGLRGSEIGQVGMIAAIVDHYDAITSDRAYSDAVTPYRALMRLYEWRDSLFEGTLVEKFIQCLGIYPIGTVVRLNSGEVGVVAAINRKHRLKPFVVLALRADRTPFLETPIVNLATWSTPGKGGREIDTVLDGASVGVDPGRYLRAAVAY